MQRRREPYYGFEHFEIATNHGDLVAGDYLLWARARTTDFDAMRDSANAIPDDRYSAPQARRTRIPEELYSSSYLAERTVAFLEPHAGSGRRQPFFLQMAFPDPHYPFTPPGRYWDMYDPEAVALPASFDADSPMMVARLKAVHREGMANREWHAPFAVDPREAREIIALTYGMISMIDDCVGAALDALKRLRLDDRTIIVFTSDHGDYMADHGIVLKGSMDFQPAINSEVQHRRSAISVVRAVRLAGESRRRGGIQPNNGVQGRDLLDPDLTPDSILIESDNPFGGPLAGAPARTRTLLTEGWRFSVHQNLEKGEMYDLATDLGEVRNLWNDPRYAARRAQLAERLLRRMMDFQENAPLQTGLS